MRLGPSAYRWAAGCRCEAVFAPCAPEIVPKTSGVPENSLSIFFKAVLSAYCNRQIPGRGAPLLALPKRGIVGGSRGLPQGFVEEVNVVRCVYRFEFSCNIMQG